MLLLLLLLAAAAGLAAATKLPLFVFTVPGRYQDWTQWMGNFGYCGEVSFLQASMRFGGFASEYDVRAMASPGIPQSRSSSQLVLGTNDLLAAKQMRLNVTQFTGHTTQQFLLFIKRSVLEGKLVTFGVLDNSYDFYGPGYANYGYSSYDHIVTAYGVQSNHPLNDTTTFFKDDAILFTDHGLYKAHNNVANTYRGVFGSFGPRTKQQANLPSAPVYSISAPPNYATAFNGILDAKHQALPVQLLTNALTEIPAIKDGHNTRPAPMPINFTVVVSGLSKGQAFTLVRFDSFLKVPTQDFVTSPNVSEVLHLVASGPTFSMNISSTTAHEIIYRAQLA